MIKIIITKSDGFLTKGDCDDVATFLKQDKNVVGEIQKDGQVVYAGFFDERTFFRANKEGK